MKKLVLGLLLLSLYPHERDLIIHEVAVGSRGLSFAEQVAVCEVILNRAESGGSVPSAVAYLLPYSGGREPNADELRLAEDALDQALGGAELTGGAVEFVLSERGLKKFDFFGERNDFGGGIGAVKID